jgi:hypothetical protein
MRNGTRKLRIGAAFAACAALACALIAANSLNGGAAQSSSAAGLLDALPTGASMLVYLDLATIRASSFYQHRPDRGPIALPNQDYADFVRATGFDFEKDLDRAAIESWSAPSQTQLIQNVAIAEGRFDRAKIRTYAESQGKIDHQHGHEVFLFPAGAQGGWNSAFFLDEHRLALVSGRSIDPLFSSRSGDPATDAIRERASHLDGAAAFAITHVSPIPPDAPGAAGLPGGAATSQLMGLARSLRWITFAARPEGDNLRLSLEGECDNGEDARQLQTTLELLRVLGRVGLESPKTRDSMSPAALASLQSVLNSAQVAQTDQRVRVLVELTPDIFKAGTVDEGK